MKNPSTALADVKESDKLGEILLKCTSLTRAQLEEALKIQGKDGGRLVKSRIDIPSGPVPKA